MKKRLFLFIPVLFFLVSGTVSGQPCADPSNIYTFLYNGKTYEVVQEMKSWSDAAGCAIERGGYLVEINSLEEQNAVYDAIINGAGVSTTYTVVADGGGVAYVWIGATDKVTEGTWLWDGNNDDSGINFWVGQGTAGNGTGAPVGGNYVNWGGTSTGVWKEPDDFNSNQYAAAIGLKGWPGGTGTLGIAGEWNDINILNVLYFVVEKDDATGFGPGNSIDPVEVFPNPATQKISVITHSPGTVISAVTISALTGIPVFKNEKVNSAVFSGSVLNLDPGCYFLTVELNDGTKITRKLLVRH